MRYVAKAAPELLGLCLRTMFESKLLLVDMPFVWPARVFVLVFGLVFVLVFGRARFAFFGETDSRSLILTIQVRFIMISMTEISYNRLL